MKTYDAWRVSGRSGEALGEHGVLEPVRDPAHRKRELQPLGVFRNALANGFSRSKQKIAFISLLSVLRHSPEYTNSY